MLSFYYKNIGRKDKKFLSKYGFKNIYVIIIIIYIFKDNLPCLHGN